MKNQPLYSKKVFTPFLKLFFVGIIFIFQLNNLKAQTPADTTFGYHYKTVVEIPIYLCSLTGQLEKDTAGNIQFYEAPANAVFTHIGDVGDTAVIIRFWVWKSKFSEAIKEYNYDSTANDKSKYFLMSKTDFQEKTIRRYNSRPSFTMGSVVLPFKIRSRSFSFTGDVGIGAVAGAKFRLGKYSDNNFFNVLVGIALSQVNLDSTNTMGTITTSSPVQTPSALTASVGGVFEFSNIQIGVFVGRDYINNNDLVNWVYQGKTWVSIGVGYALFTKSSAGVIPSAGTNNISLSGI